jgi:amino acid transporter
MSDLRKSLGFPALIAMGMGGVVGTSWIYTNGLFFAKYGAGGEIFGFIIGIALAAFVALAYAELAALLPRAGGEVIYGYLAFNRGTGFIAGWLLIGAFTSSLGFYVAVAGELLTKVWPELHSIPIYSIAHSTVYLPEIAVGIILILIVFGINVWGMNLGAQVQILLLVSMLVIGLVLAFTGFAHGHASNFWPPYSPQKGAVLPTLRFVLPAMSYLTGFSLVAILAEDANLPPRRIGTVVVLTVILAGSFYTFVLLGSAWLIPWTQTATLAKGTIDAFRIAGFPVLSWGAYVIAILGLLTSLVALFIATSRIILALARAGLFPRMFARTNEQFGTPTNALIFTLVIGIGLGLLGHSALLWFIDTGGIYIGLAWFIGVTSMYMMRRRYPHVERTYTVRRSWLPIIGGVAAVLIIFMTLLPNTSMSLAWPYEYIILGVWLLLGLLIYFLGPREKNDKQSLKVLLGSQYEKFFPESEQIKSHYDL